MTGRKTYHGGCQCGAVQFDVDAALSGVVACNCSRCRRVGSLLAFVPAADFRLTRGEEALTTFEFNTRRIRHRFCATCGIQSFSQGTAPNGAEMVAINVRCLEGVDAGALPVTYHDGAAH